MHQQNLSKPIENADSNNEEEAKTRYNVGPFQDDPLDPKDIVILLMGPTGTGKSTFIATLTGDDTGVGHGLCSETAEVVRYPYQLPSGKRAWLVDIPAFDDARCSDADILEISSAWLAATYSRSIIPSGILFFQRISDHRPSGTTIKNLTMCRKICGQSALQNTVIVSTFWDHFDPRKGQANERSFSEDPHFWKPFIDRGCRVQRFAGSRQSGIDIINSFEKTSRIPLQIQTEMVDRGKKPGETSAGILVITELENQVKQIDQDALELVKARMQTNGQNLRATREELEKLQRDRIATKERITRLKRNLWQKIVDAILRAFILQIRPQKSVVR